MRYQLTNYLIRFMYINATDPDGTMSWFISELDKAEKAGDKVWIISHISNDLGLESWSKVYYEVINRLFNKYFKYI